MIHNNKVQQGKALVIFLCCFVAFILAVIGICAVSYVGQYNYGNRVENELIAIKSNNKNIYAQGTQAILEIAQVPKMYAKDLQEIVTSEIQGKYGKEGSKATVQFLTDRNITLPPNLYSEITQQIKAFRAKFEANQTRMIDVSRSYTTSLGNLWQGIWLRIAGYPKINLKDYEPITTDLTEEVYQRGKEKGPLKIN